MINKINVIIFGAWHVCGFQYKPSLFYVYSIPYFTC